nr:hypothetical protein [Tanacetum cinerariifolium]
MEEKKRKSRTPQLKRRLFKVRIESSAEKSLGDQEDTSNQGRNDQDEGISFVQDAEIQGRYDHDIEINTASISITIANINITTVEPVTTVSTPITTVGVSVSTAEPNHELAKRLQVEEQGELSIKERGSGKKVESSRKEAVSKKRARKGLDEESVKRQKLKDDAKKEELKACLEIVQHDDSAINIESLATKYSIVD